MSTTHICILKLDPRWPPNISSCAGWSCQVDGDDDDEGPPCLDDDDNVPHSSPLWCGCSPCPEFHSLGPPPPSQKRDPLHPHPQQIQNSSSLLRSDCSPCSECHSLGSSPTKIEEIFAPFSFSFSTDLKLKLSRWYSLRCCSGS